MKFISLAKIASLLAIRLNVQILVILSLSLVFLAFLSFPIVLAW